MLTELALLSLLTFGSSPDCGQMLSGQVVDAVTNLPVASAQITNLDANIRTSTDQQGNFALTGLCSTELNLKLTSPNYFSEEKELNGQETRKVLLSLNPLLPDTIEHLVVQGRRTRSMDTRSIASLDESAIRRESGKNLADTLAALPGVSVLRSGNIAKPIVRGQHSARLLMLYDGVRHEGQDWGMNHGVEIDPFSAGSMEVVKGSAGVRYGPDAIAGVLLVNTPEMLDESGIRTETLTVGALNGRRGTMAGRVEGNHDALPGLSWRLDGNYSRGAGLETPNYPLDNTGIEEWNSGAAVTYDDDCWSLKVSYHRKNETSGVCMCVRKETTADFDAQVVSNTPPNVELYDSDYEIDRPYHGVIHDIAIARGKFDFENLGELEITYGFQRNDRKEYEIIRSESSVAQHNFILRTHTGDVSFRHYPIKLSENLKLEGLAGISSILQENVYRGWPLLSDYRAFGGGVFALERLIFEDFEIEAGVRFDHTTRHAYLPKKTYQSLAREGRINPEDCKLGDDFTRCDKSFNAVTYSLGSLVHLSSGIKAKLDLSSATRAPTINEQYLNGTSPSFPVMARGNHTLDPETSWSGSATLDATSSWFSGELSLYGSYIDDYIYLAPELREDGTIRTDVLIQGRFPRFSYEAIDAVFYGIDADTVVRFGALDLGLQASVVRAKKTEDNEFLLFIPPDQVSAELKYHFEDSDWSESTELSFNATYIARQYNVSAASDFAPVPDGYALFGAEASTKLYIGDGRYLLSLEIQNLLNSRYRDYTSLLRYFADEPGRQVYLRFGTEFGPERS